MKVVVMIEKEVEIKYLLVDVDPRYWEDSTVNGIEDEQGTLIPCRDGISWKPIIDIESGVITNWEKGVKADIHYKVCDAGFYQLADANGNVYLQKEGYVPKILDLYNDSFGDYVIMKVDENGLIEKWNSNPNIDDFTNED